MSKEEKGLYCFQNFVFANNLSSLGQKFLEPEPARRILYNELARQDLRHRTVLPGGIFLFPLLDR